MDIAIIITFCTLLLIAYLFDLTASRSKIPSVILLLLTGWVVRQLTGFFGIQLPDFSSILPILGTLGLILIVLEGSLELEFDIKKIRLIVKSLLGAVVPMLILSFTLAWVFHHFGKYDFKSSLINAIPLCIVSSAIAIPTVRYMRSSDREFITYESSFSDIIGVLFFNYLIHNEGFSAHSFGIFSASVLGIVLISVVAIIGLSFLLNRIEHHVKFVPIILLVILIYAAAEVYYLPALVFILLFGLYLGNLDKVKKIKWMEKFHPESLDTEVKRFKVLTIEAAFLIRAAFFMLFGYLLETSEILNTDTLLWAGCIVLFIVILRTFQLYFSKIPLFPLLLITPRGLITILLFLSIEPYRQVHYMNRSLVIQVIILTALLMMIGMMIPRRSGS